MSYVVWSTDPSSFSQPFTPTNDIRLDGVRVKMLFKGDPTFTSITFNIEDYTGLTLVSSAARTKSAILGSNTDGLIDVAFTFANPVLLNGGDEYKLTGDFTGDSFTSSSRAEYVINHPDPNHTITAGAATAENILVYPYDVQFIGDET